MDESAFPGPPSYSASGHRMDDGTRGMTLRDWFAGQMLPGVIGYIGFGDPASVASSAYELADAMLAERSK